MAKKTFTQGVRDYPKERLGKPTLEPRAPLPRLGIRDYSAGSPLSLGKIEQGPVVLENPKKPRLPKL